MLVISFPLPSCPEEVHDPGESVQVKHSALVIFHHCFHALEGNARLVSHQSTARQYLIQPGLALPAFADFGVEIIHLILARGFDLIRSDAFGRQVYPLPGGHFFHRSFLAVEKLSSPLNL